MIVRFQYGHPCNFHFECDELKSATLNDENVFNKYDNEKQIFNLGLIEPGVLELQYVIDNEEHTDTIEMRTI